LRLKNEKINGFQHSQPSQKWLSHFLAAPILAGLFLSGPFLAAAQLWTFPQHY